MSRLARANAWARRLRPLAALRSLGDRSSLRRTREAYRTLGIRRPAFGSVRHSRVSAPRGDLPRLDRPGGVAALADEPGFDSLPEPVRRQLQSWPERGYLVLEGFYSPESVERVNAEVDELLGGGELRYHHRSPRVMNAWRRSPAAAELVADRRLLDILVLIMGRQPLLFQTINFIVGSQQGAHSDAFHMMTEPPGFMVGVWVALEDIDSDAGPVFYLPGSHTLPYVMSEQLDLPRSRPLMVADKGKAYTRKMKQVVAESGSEPVAFTASKGDVLVWHHNLLHGGSAIEREGATRRSMVAHYFGEGALCYHEITERPALIPARQPVAAES